jgi:hypothetical protein
LLRIPDQQHCGQNSSRHRIIRIRTSSISMEEQPGSHQPPARPATPRRAVSPVTSGSPRPSRCYRCLGRDEGRAPAPSASDLRRTERISRRFTARLRTPDPKPAKAATCGRSVSTAIGPTRPTPVPGIIRPDFSRGIPQRPTPEKRIAATAIIPASSAPRAM